MPITLCVLLVNPEINSKLVCKGERLCYRQAFIDKEEDRYLQIIAEGNKALAKALNKYRPVSCLTGTYVGMCGVLNLKRLENAYI